MSNFFKYVKFFKKWANVPRSPLVLNISQTVVARILQLILRLITAYSKGYSKAHEQPQSSAWPICQSHAMTRTGRELTTTRIAAYWSSPRYALRHSYSLPCPLPPPLTLSLSLSLSLHLSTYIMASVLHCVMIIIL